MIKYFISILILLSFISTAYSQSITDDYQLIQSILINQQEGWNRGDIESYMQGYWKSDSLLFTSGGTIQRGWKATYEKYKKSYDSKAKMGNLDFSNFEINLLSSESAWIFGNWELKRKKDNLKGIFTLILKKFNNGWNIIHDHTSIQK